MRSSRNGSSPNATSPDKLTQNQCPRRNNYAKTVSEKNEKNERIRNWKLGTTNTKDKKREPTFCLLARGKFRRASGSLTFTIKSRMAVFGCLDWFGLGWLSLDRNDKEKQLFKHIRLISKLLSGQVCRCWTEVSWGSAVKLQEKHASPVITTWRRWGKGIRDNAYGMDLTSPHVPRQELCCPSSILRHKLCTHSIFLQDIRSQYI